MPQASIPPRREGDVAVLVGTVKGAFICWSSDGRKSWQLDGPHFKGESVYAMALDQRGGRRRILAGTRSFHWGSIIRSSDDLGATWTAPDRQNIKFPADADLALTQVWQIRPGAPDEPDKLYCGVEPAALFESRDAGDTWHLVEGLHAHEHRPQWQPGGGGLCLHTIVVDPAEPKRILVAISTGGVYRSDDGGKTWHARNKGVRAEFMPDKHPEFGQCVHKVARAASGNGRLYLQNHWGLYRSDDWGDSWHDIANGVPSDFGFAMDTHPVDADTAYIVPLESDGFRCTPEAKMRVYRTRNAGKSWEALTDGLPQTDAYETVLRDGLCTDSLDPAGVYVGTRNGKLFASADAGDGWQTIADGLPAIVCVKAGVIGPADGAVS